MRRVIFFALCCVMATIAAHVVRGQGAPQSPPRAGNRGEIHAGEFYFRMPDGWKQAQAGNVTALFAPDLTPNTVTGITLATYPLDKNLRTTFGKVWDALQKNYKVDHASELQTANQEGVETAVMSGNLEDRSGTKFIAMQLLVRNGDHAEGVLYMTSDISRAAADQQTLQAFLATLHFDAPPRMEQGAPAAYGATITTNSPANPGPLTGIYRAASRPGVDATASLQSWDPATKTPNYSFLVFFPDGRVRKGLPTMGLGQYVDESAMRLDVSSGGIIAAKWGTYQMAGAQGRIVFVTHEVWPIAVFQDHLEIDGDVYLRMEGGAGMRLQGTYKPYGDMKSPGITFTPDGDFKDEGILHSDTAMAIGMSGGGVTVGYGFASPGPGPGTYQISNFGITLRYANGQAPAALFYAEPSANSGMPQQIFVNNVKFVRVQ